MNRPTFSDLATNSEYDGIIKSEVCVKIQLRKIEEEGNKNRFILTFDEKSYELLMKTLNTGAPVWIGLQKVKP
jgi:hypothetical protein